MTTTSRIEDLRRRVDRDPASFSFAHLAEEHCRNRDYEAAVRVARAGLVHLPGYLTARVTLGRALLQLGQVEEARRELESVVATAPDNLAAVRALAEIHDRSRATVPAFHQLDQFVSENALPGVTAATAAEVIPAEETPSPDAQASATLERWLSAIVADRANRG